MSQISWVYFTCAKVSEARKLASFLVENRLAACANILAPCESVYEWKSKVQITTEIPVLCKTRTKSVSKLIAALEKAHSYEVPGISAVKVHESSEPFSKWIKDQVLK